MEDVRALLLTDVVDSTRLSEVLGDRVMAEVWTSHDRMARDLLPVWRGREIDKTDGMLLLFESASDAVNYALAYHQALATLPVVMKARAGLHVGQVMLRENSAADVERGAKPLEVDGLAKPTAARVMSLALAGQTLLSDGAQCALGEGSWPVRSLGHWMFKGLTEPVELFEVVADESAFRIPSDGEKAYRVMRIGEQWLPVAQIPNNLPQQITSFVGRGRERREVRAALEATRLVTLLGMGGVGKTRLSLEVAADMRVHFPDGAWFLDLAPIRDPALVAGEVAQVLGVREEPDRPLLQMICAALKPRRMLLIFDNCEHLIKACADLTHAILRVAPQVRVLATSREPLRVPGEQSYPVLPLPVPARGDGMDALSRSAAVRLFVERAQLHKPAFVLSEREAPAVTELVARLEGIPLALELAAARMRAMSVSDINARLNQRYKLLTGGDRVLLERQQTLSALVDWSYDMLADDERAVLNRLAVFAGGFDVKAAEQICGADPLEPSAVLDLLTSLVEKSLVMAEENDACTRYRLLETIRDYARDKLERTGEMAEAAARHCQHYFAFAKEVSKGLHGPDQARWIVRMEADLENVRAGIAVAMVGGVDPVIAVKYAVAMQPFWMMRGYTTEGRNTVAAALQLPAVQAFETARGHALYVGAALAESQSDLAQARTMLEQCLALRRKLGNRIDIGATLSTLAVTRLEMGDAEAAREGELEALAIFREQGDRPGEAVVLLQLGQINAWVGDGTQAREYLDACLALARELGYREVEAECELVIGAVDLERGAQELARERFMRSLTISYEAADKRGEARVLWWLAKADLEDRAFDVSRNRLGQALRAFRAFEMRKELLGCLEDCAILAHLGNLNDLAVRLASASMASRRRLSLIRAPWTELRSQVQLDRLRDSMSSESFREAWDVGRRCEVDEAIEWALIGLNFSFEASDRARRGSA